MMTTENNTSLSFFSRINIQRSIKENTKLYSARLKDNSGNIRYEILDDHTMVEHWGGSGGQAYPKPLTNFMGKKTCMVAIDGRHYRIESIKPI